MDYIRRKLEVPLTRHLERGKNILLLGPRQVGKTTILNKIPADLSLSLLDRGTRIHFEKNPEDLQRRIEAIGSTKKRRILVIIDEIQKNPDLLDPIQLMIDRDVAQFILTGSSARKLRRQQEVNLLPGRVVNLRLDPLSTLEISPGAIEDLLYYGSLPGIVLTPDNQDKEVDLRSYVESYLEEEVRSEALVRKMGEFARFLELAGIESGNVMNYSEIASDIGVSKNTIASYFEILFDCLVAERIEPITHSVTRKKLTKTNRFLIFDLGVRRLCANEGTKLSPERLGTLFEQFVGLELIRLLRLVAPAGRLRYWRDPDGPEVDWIIDYQGRYLPIEVKWTSTPNIKHGKHLVTFRQEYSNQTMHRGYIVCRTASALKLTEWLWAIPWQQLPEIVNDLQSPP
jgi:predicted AAA+ superfamily ATPase